MPKKSSSKTSKQSLDVATWEMPKKSLSKKPPKKLPVAKEKPSSTSKSFGEEIDDIFSKKRKSKKGEKKEDETVEKKKKRSKSGGSNVEMFENEQSVRPKRKTGDGLVIYSEEELGIGKADAGGTRLCPFDCDCCF